MKHQMLGYKDGDWIKFLCPDCDKQTWVNTETGEYKSFGGSFRVLHHGGDIKLKTEVENGLKSQGWSR